MEATKVTLSFCLRAIHALGIMLLPFLPGAASKIVSAFGREASTASWRDAVDVSVVGLPLTQPPILFQKLGAALVQK